MYVARHNNKILKQASDQEPKPPPKCNCQKSKKMECPVPGACNQRGVVYQATVSSEGGRNIKKYIGLAKDFKQRYSKHKKSMKYPSPRNSTTLSTHFLAEEARGHQPKVTCKFLKTNVPTFNPVTGKCALCTSEKFFILFKPEEAILNSRTEVFWACRHKQAELLVPPDPKSQGGWEFNPVAIIQWYLCLVNICLRIG